ncbi:hypothetical protein GQ53DRAFT_650292 [Thozetella sp. PMI_491]|nr:hypothetical protein GQ53DRAFT_650292 [Thozetella sp. PMI_491]
MVSQTTAGLTAAALVALSPGALAFITPCVYQEYACGHDMISNFGYNNTELASAVNKTSTMPPLTSVQLLHAIYRCVDINGTIVGNSFCMGGCIPMGSTTTNDQCAM